MPVSLFLIVIYTFSFRPASHTLGPSMKLQESPCPQSYSDHRRASCPLLHRFLRVMGCRRHFPYRRVVLPENSSQRTAKSMQIQQILSAHRKITDGAFAISELA